MRLTNEEREVLCDAIENLMVWQVSKRAALHSLLERNFVVKNRCGFSGFLGLDRLQITPAGRREMYFDSFEPAQPAL